MYPGFRNRNGYINFIRDPDGTSPIHKTKSVEKNSLRLDNFKAKEVLKYIPRNFTLTTNNSSGQFNIDMIKDSSSVISKLINDNPNCLKYHINIDDNENILGKFEQLYLGEKVIFTEDDLPVSKKITGALEIKRCPNYMKPEILKTHENENNFKLGLNCGVGIDESDFCFFYYGIKNNTFKITTKSNSYMCNRYSIFISQVIRERLLQDPSIQEYEYDFDDENNEFQLMCKILNNNTVSITPSNMYSIKQMSEDLQIDLILPQIISNINENENKSKTIDELQAVIDANEELFEWLYNIDKLTVETVNDSIMKSEWIKTEDNVYELAVVILHVIDTSINLHPYLIELIIQLNNGSKKATKLNALLPFILNKLRVLIGKNLTICSFIYNLYKQGIIPKEELSECLSKPIDKNQANSTIVENIIAWFLPELFELKILNNNSIKSDNQIYFHNFRYKVDHTALQYFSFYLDKIDDYKRIRDGGKPEDALTRAIFDDDDFKAQEIISNSNIDLETYELPYNIFERFINNGHTTLINYAAAHGSTKCFKYLKLNHSILDSSTFYYAICGGNTEIIRYVEQELSTSELYETKKSDRKPRNNRIIKSIDMESQSPIIQAIRSHRNDLFDWIFENNYLGKDELNKSEILLRESVINGNAHSLIKIIDLSIIACNFQILIQAASSKGYYKIAKLIFILMNKRSNEFASNFNSNLTNNSLNLVDKIHNNKTIKMEFNDSFVCLDNLSIFKLGIQLINNPSQIKSMFIYSIIHNYKNIFDYYLDEILRKQFDLTDFEIFVCIQKALNCQSDHFFNNLIKTFIEINPYIFIQFDYIQYILNLIAQTKHINYFKTIYDILIKNRIIHSKEKAFVEALKFNSKEIVQFLIDQKLNYLSIVNEIAEIGTISKEIFLMILDNTSIEIKDNLIDWSLYPAIKTKNKELVEYLLNNRKSYDNALIHAIHTNDIDIVETVLKFNSDPYFVNQRSKEGIALCIAVKNENLEIVQRLLKIPGIDPNLYELNNQTPLICSIVNFNLDITNEILDFYGDEIHSQIWQIDKAIEKALGNLTSYKNKAENNQLLNILKRILKIKNINPNCRSGDYTLLSYACEANEIELVQILLKTDGIDVNAYTPINGNTPLIAAIKKQNIEISELLINDQRTNINSRNYENKTALTIAVDCKLENIVNLLIKNDRFDPDKSLINEAFYFSNVEISKLLLSTNSVDINYRYLEIISNFNNITKNIRCVEYSTPLNYAVQKNLIEKVKLIAENPSFDRNKSLLKKSIFYLAKDKNIDFDLFNLLIKLNENDINIYNDDDLSLLMTAAVSNNEPLINAILSNDNFDSKKSNIVRAFNLSFYSDSNSYEMIFEFDQSHDHLIDLNKLLPNGYSYYTFIKKGHLSKFNFLIENGADLNIPDKDDVYPLEYAIYLCNLRLVKLLLDSDKIDFNKQITNKNIKIITKYQQDESSRHSFQLKTIYSNISKAKYTTYFLLAASSDPSILKLFINKGTFDINAKDENGDTPLIIACRAKILENISLLFNCKYQDLDYSHCNNNGEDALKVIGIQANPKDKNEYKKALLNMNKNNNNNNNNQGTSPNQNTPIAPKIKTNVLPQNLYTNKQNHSLNKTDETAPTKVNIKINEDSTQNKLIIAKSGTSNKSKESLHPPKNHMIFNLNDIKLSNENKPKKRSESHDGSNNDKRTNNSSFEKIALKNNKQDSSHNSASLNESSTKQTLSNNHNEPSTEKSAPKFDQNQKETSKSENEKESSDDVKSINDNRNLSEKPILTSKMKLTNDFDDGDDDVFENNQIVDYQYDLMLQQQQQEFMQQQFQQFMNMAYISQLQFNNQMMAMNSLLSSNKSKKKKKSSKKNKK